MKRNVLLSLALAPVLSGCSLFEEKPCESSQAKEFLDKEIRQYDLLRYEGTFGQIKNYKEKVDQKIISDLKMNANEIVEISRKLRNAYHKCTSSRMGSFFAFAELLGAANFYQYKEYICKGEFGPAWNYMSRMSPETSMFMRASGFSVSDIAHETPKTYAPDSYKIYNNEIKKYLSSYKMAMKKYRDNKDKLNEYVLSERRNVINGLDISFLKFYEFEEEAKQRTICKSDLMFSNRDKKLTIKIRAIYVANKFGDEINYTLDFFTRMDESKIYVHKLIELKNNHAVRGILNDLDNKNSLLFEEADNFDQFIQDYGDSGYFMEMDYG